MHLVSTLLEHMCNLKKIVRLSSSQRDIYLFLIMRNQNFEKQSILYEEFNSYTPKNRKNITPHIQALDRKKVLTLTYAKASVNGEIFSNVMQIQLHALETVKLLLNK
jgi:hypothetical protein